MARRRGEAWVTYVANDKAVPPAMVLAASLRQSNTSKRISVIITTALSKESGKILRQGFDDAFLLDDNVVSSDVSEGCGSDALRGKIYAFSLAVYGKCVFLPAATMVLENCDDLFGSDDIPDRMITDFSSGRMDIFLFTPRLALCEFLADSRSSQQDVIKWGDFLTDHVSMWLRNNRTGEMGPGISDCDYGIGRISGIGRHLLECGHQLRMVNFVDIPDDGFVLTLESFGSDPKLGLFEKNVVEKWLEIYGSQVAGTLINPCASLEWKNKHEQRRYDNEPIAIIGMSCRFPGASNLEEFWELLHSGKEGVCVPPSFRWKKEHTIIGGSLKERETHAGFLTVPVDEFDSKFFGVSPKDTLFLDPQARLLHEVMWEGLENGGVDPLNLRGSHTGIFTGSWMNDYKDIVQTSTERDFFRTYMGNSLGATAARLSFLLGVTGPSIATESGCSSAIVAVDLAVKSLRNGETNLAIAGGVNLLLHPFQGDLIDYVIAPDGRCKTFDEKANGFGRAEGCGVLVLKRLSDALRDRDHIWAMIRGSAISQEGMSRSLGTPTAHCEALAMELALRDAGVNPEQVGFVETHGTGTSVGDPMEVEAITKVYHSKARKHPLIIGSVKTNVGHTESCSGITGIIKTVLALQNEMIPKHLNFDTLNSEINLDAIPAQIPLEAVPWPKAQGHSRIAGVSSFGITGTDGHVVLEEAPDYSFPRFTTGLERPLHLIKFSGKNKEALDGMVKDYEELFRKQRNILNFAEIAYTTNTGRASFNHRAFLLARNFEEAATTLQSDKFLYGDTSGKENYKICFLFTGQGSQYVGMAKILYETNPVFRVHFDQCENILRRQYNLSLREALWESEGTSGKLSRTIYSQTSIFCVEYCLLKLWESWGIQPDCVLGHSLGEFCAATAAGLMSFEDTLMLVAERSRLIDTLPGGSMLVIKASQPEVDKIMKTKTIDLDYAAVNSSDQTVVGGDTEKIVELLNVCKEEDIKAVVLDATHAFHSRHMDPMLKEYRKITEKVKYSSSLKCQYISGVRGTLLGNVDFQMNADYWMDHTRQKVSFLDACESLKKLKCTHFVEIGPQPVLSTFVMQNIDNQPVSCYPSLRRNTDDWDTILTSLGKLYLSGVTVDWEGFDKPYSRKKAPSTLPFHPFHRKSFWTDCSTISLISVHPLIGSCLSNASPLHIFQNNLNLNSVPFLKDHCLGEKVVVPGAAFAEMCLSAGHFVTNSLTEILERPTRPLALENLTIEAPLAILNDKACRLQVIADLPENAVKDAADGESEKDAVQNGLRVKIFHQTDVESSDTVDKWILHATATFVPVFFPKDVMSTWRMDRVKELMSSSVMTSTQAFYKRFDGVGLKFGDLFKSIQGYWGNLTENMKNDIVAEVKLPKDHDNYLIHPIIIDAMIQAVILSSLQTQAEVLSVPTRIGKLVWLNSVAESSKKIYLHTTWEKDNCIIFAADATLNPIACMSDVQFIETTVNTIESILEQQNSSIPDSWEETWKPLPGPLDNRVQQPNWGRELNTADFANKLKGITTIVAEDWELDRKTKRLIYLYQIRALQRLGWSPHPGESFGVAEFCDKHAILPMYHQLVHHYFAVCNDENGMLEFHGEENLWEFKGVPITPAQVEMEIYDLYTFLKDQANLKEVVGIYHAMGERLHNILCGNESALQLLFSGDTNKPAGISAELYYQNYPGVSEVLRKVVEIFKVAMGQVKEANQGNPNAKLRILEVGAGTGCMAQDALWIIQDHFGPKYEYYYTDISGSFFVKAADKLKGFKKNLKFCTFDIEKSGLTQGIPVNYFDLVICSDVLHATRNLEETLRNLREVLRPDGKLFFTETITQDRGATFVFGLLEGYWRFDDFHWRPRHSCVGSEVWRRLLLHSGYEDIYIAEVYLDTTAVISAQVSSKYVARVSSSTSITNQNQWIIFGKPNDFHRKLISRLTMYGANSVTLVLPSLDDTAYFRDMNCLTRVVGVDDGGTQLDSILSQDQLYAVIYAWGMDAKKRDQKEIALPFLLIVQKLLTLKSPPKIFVCTGGVHPINRDTHVPSNPSASVLFGMTKTLKNENSDWFVRCVDLEYDTENGKIVDVLVDEILYELAMHKTSREKDRVPVAYREGQRYEPRFGRARNLIGEELKLPPSTDRYQLVLPTSKMIQDLQYDVLEEMSVGDSEVEVNTKAYALNFRDVMAILKPMETFENINGVGIDYAGVVTKVGTGISQDKIKVGDRVFGLNTNDMPLSSHLVVHSDQVKRIPDRMTYEEAATLPVVFATSLLSLVDVAQMKKGETVLIHAGAGGVGLAAIQVAQRLGADIMATAGSTRKRAYLKSLGIQHIFHSRNTEYREEILKVTQGRGVDIVLNSLTGPGFKEASLDVTAKRGRFLELSKLAVWTEAEVRERRPDVKYKIVDLSDETQFSWKGLFDRVDRYLTEEHLHAIPYVKFDALLIRQALQFLQKAKHIGKVVVTMPEIKTVEGKRKVAVPLFNSQSTYLITGGLGGIGFEVCKWMLEKGATNIVLVGRHPPKLEMAEEINCLNSSNKGRSVTVMQGDVGNYNDCKRIIDEVTKNCGDKPIRGIQHCAGVLQDNLYGNQTWASFDATFNPKVAGTWNLHELTLDLPLEHFVLYSSISAVIGFPTQANHAAANCFEDAFAHYRDSLGLPATAINWGQWAQVGCAKEINVPFLIPVSVKRMLKGLEIALRSAAKQVSFSGIGSFHTCAIISPTLKHSLDERLLKDVKGDKGQRFSAFLKTDQFWGEFDAAEDKTGKCAVVTLYIKSILREALRMEADEAIDVNANMQDLGVDSLMLIELKNSIQGLMGSRVTVTAHMFKDCHTIRELSTVLVNKILDNAGNPASEAPLSPEEYTSLLESDCILEERIRPSLPPRGAVSAIKTVLITGVTGQLGPYILSGMGESPYNALEKIVCLIRTKEGKCPKEKLQNILESMNLASKVDMSKVECLRGDLTQLQFGLSEEAYNELTDSVDSVFHIAANMQQVESYRKCEQKGDVRSVNVEGTLNVLRFAATGITKYVYFASSILSVFGGNHDPHLCEDWPEENQIKGVADNKIPGYLASKFVCEILLKRATERGIPCKIFRFPWLLGESTAGQLHYEDNPYILRFLSYLKIKSMPTVALPAIILPVDICADWSLKLFWNENTPNEIYNICHPHPQLEREFVEVAKEHFGVQLELVEWRSKEFVEKLSLMDMPSGVLREIYKDVDMAISAVDTDTFRAVHGGVNSRVKFFRSRKLDQFLPPEYFHHIPSTMDIIRKNLHFVKSQGGF